MPFTGPTLRGFAKEIYLDSRVEQLAKIYRASRIELLRLVNGIDVTEFQRARAEVLLAQVDREIERLNRLARGWTTSTMPIAYTHGLDVSEERLRALGITKYVNMSASVHKEAVAVLVDDVTLDLLVANQTIKRNVVRLVRATQQQVLEDRQISSLIAKGMVEGETRKQISDRIREQFEKQMGEGKLITVNGRNYDPEGYSRMVARSRVSEASNQANINASLQYGVDLVQVDIHAGSCEICDPYQGKIFSISGTDKDFPQLKERPPFHPNCRHQLLPMTREALEDRGQLQGAIRFSNASAQQVSTVAQYEEVAHA